VGDVTERSITPPAWVQEHLDEIYNWVQDHEDAASRIEAAAVIIDLNKAQLEGPLARMRAADLRVLKAQGWSYSSLAEAFKLSRGRLHQIVEG